MRYNKIDEFEICNGKGIGVSLFVQGCPYHCEGCFNPDTWDFDGGKKWTINEQNLILKLLGNDYIDRLSILGGEPLAIENRREVLELIKAVRDLYGHNKKIWLYTGSVIDEKYSSRNSNDICENNFSLYRIIQLCDYIVDGPFIHSKYDPTLEFRGSKNQRIIKISS